LAFQDIAAFEAPHNRPFAVGQDDFFADCQMLIEILRARAHDQFAFARLEHAA
jgi:hypothetical protein